MGLAAAARWKLVRPGAPKIATAESVQDHSGSFWWPARSGPAFGIGNGESYSLSFNNRQHKHFIPHQTLVCASASPQVTQNLTPWKAPTLWKPSKQSSLEHHPIQSGCSLNSRSISAEPGSCDALASSGSGPTSSTDVLKDAGNPRQLKAVDVSDPTDELEFDTLNWSFNRSGLVRGLVLGIGACMLGQEENAAEAVGLISFPPAKLTNNYFLVRAGESEVESQGLIMTNPVAKTSMDSGLSKIGRQQVMSTIRQLDDLGACTANCWIWPSITQRAYQTAELLASAFSIGRSRIVPEYSFLDARGLGSYEGRSLAQIQEVYEADKSSPYWRPPPFVDGTPNESVEDVLVRVRQLMSILETQYQGEQVVIVSPDSDNLSVLQAALLGADLRQHSGFSFRPGEARKIVLNAEAPPAPTSGFFKCKQRPNRQWDCAI